MARLLNQVAAFHYVTAPNAPTYRAIMQVFFDAKQHYLIELRPADVWERIRDVGYHVEIAGDEHLEAHLQQLVDWGNLLRGYETAAAARIEDYYRKRYLYHLTPVGEAAHRAVLEVEATVGRSGSLQTTMLVKIRDALAGLASSGGARHEPDRLVRALHDLYAAFDTLTQEANRFIGDLKRHLGEPMAEERFILHKQAVLAYISRFVEQLRHLSAEIAAGIHGVGAAGADVIIETAAASADLPPALDIEIAPRDLWIAEQQAKWLGVCGWFTGDAPIVERLAEVAVDAVVGLTRTLGRINERRTRPVDRAADFRVLAHWFAECGSDAEAHELWHAAFGLHSARHFHLEDEDAEQTQPSASWWEAQPVAVPVRLRTRGSTSNAGAPASAPDHSLHKQWLAQRRQRERAQIARAMSRFAGRGPLCLSDVATLHAAEFDLLLQLLDEVLSSPRTADETRSVRTADGRLTVILRPPGDDTWVTLLTPRGTLRCRNYRIAVDENVQAAKANVENE